MVHVVRKAVHVHPHRVPEAPHELDDVVVRRARIVIVPRQDMTFRVGTDGMVNQRVLSRRRKRDQEEEHEEISIHKDAPMPGEIKVVRHSVAGARCRRAHDKHSSGSYQTSSSRVAHSQKMSRIRQNVSRKQKNLARKRKKWRANGNTCRDNENFLSRKERSSTRSSHFW